jgi:hypothetical protein
MGSETLDGERFPTIPFGSRRNIPGWGFRNLQEFFGHLIDPVKIAGSWLKAGVNSNWTLPRSPVGTM